MAIPDVIKNLLSDAAAHGRAVRDNVRLADAYRQISSYNLSDATAPQVSSYAGSDILCTIYVPSHNIQGSRDPGFIEVEDQLQTITVSSARSVMPVRRLGETNPASYARGSRTIAGSMVFTTGLRDAFVKMLAKSYKDGEPRREPTLFVDQIPKFSMVFQAANELGGVSTAMLGNITLTNFGTTFSIDDIYTESTFTYVADYYFPIAEYGDKQLIRSMIMKGMLRGLPDVDLASLFEDGLSAASTIANNMKSIYLYDAKKRIAQQNQAWNTHSYYWHLQNPEPLMRRIGN